MKHSWGEAGILHTGVGGSRAPNDVGKSGRNKQAAVNKDRFRREQWHWYGMEKFLNISLTGQSLAYGGCSRLSQSMETKGLDLFFIFGNKKRGKCL